MFSECLALCRHEAICRGNSKHFFYQNHNNTFNQRKTRDEITAAAKSAGMGTTTKTRNT